MATTKNRITISLNPNVYATIKRMSELGHEPMSAIVSEMLESVHEPLMRTVAFLEAASEAPEQVRAGLRKSFERVEREMYAAAGHTVAQVDWLTGQLLPGGKAGAGGGLPLHARDFLPGSSDGVDPHSVTRGSGSKSKLNHSGRKAR